MKKYKTALVVGRFQPLHNGHIEMINKALSVAERVIILISSAQESNTAMNPFTFINRKTMILTVFMDEYIQKRIIIKPLNDIGVGNNKNWGKHVLKTAGEKIDVFVTGSEERRTNWFENSTFNIISIKKKDFLSESISATKVRESMLNNTSYWKDCVPEKLYNFYYFLIKALREAVKNKNTQAI